MTVLSMNPYSYTCLIIKAEHWRVKSKFKCSVDFKLSYLASWYFFLSLLQVSITQRYLNEIINVIGNIDYWHIICSVLLHLHDIIKQFFLFLLQIRIFYFLLLN